MKEHLKNAIVLSLDKDVSEIVQLANSLGYHVSREFIQQRKLPDVNYFIGVGKVAEIKEFIDGSNEAIDLIII